MYLFLFLTLYMFRAHRAHHQERQIVSVQPLLTVTLCRWQCRVQVGSEELRVTLVSYQESLHDARSTKCKIKESFVLTSVLTVSFHNFVTTIRRL
jgi:hypothetical protein